jgi:hypothetical protein
MNMVIAFYAAAFPEIVQDLPEVIKSEQEVLDGTRSYVYRINPILIIGSAELHDDLVSYERSKVKNTKLD